MTVYNLSPFTLPKIHDQSSLMLHWLLFSGWGREHVSVCFDDYGGQYIKNRQRCTNSNNLWLKEAYLNVTIKSGTQNSEPEIGIDGSSQNSHIRRFVWYGSSFGPLKSSRMGFCMGLEPNQPIFAVHPLTARKLPGPVAIIKQKVSKTHSDWLYPTFPRSSQIVPDHGYHHCHLSFCCAQYHYFNGM